MKEFEQPTIELHTFSVTDVISTSIYMPEDDCDEGDVTPWKPVIYLYPEKEIDVSVKLDYVGQFTCTYPAYDDGWHVIAKPDGMLTDKAGRSYYCLFWEGRDHQQYDLSKGFVVKGQDTAAFLEQTLETLGLNEKEINEFIIFWLPRMEHNPYNLITFQTEDYEKAAKLTVEPAPDSILRVFMTYKSLESPIEVEPQELKSFTRKGFSVIEWGGAEINY